MVCEVGVWEARRERDSGRSSSVPYGIHMDSLGGTVREVGKWRLKEPLHYSGLNSMSELFL